MLVSIITINFNNLTGLKKTLSSVFAQTYKSVEFILIDGGSTDGSKEYIESNVDRIDYFVSEPDNGVYHAMNKGLALAHGNYCIFMNSGDVFYDSNVLFNFKQSCSGEDLIYGLTIWSDTNLYWNPPRGIKLIDVISRALIPHQATFYNVNLLKQLGGYKEEFSIVSDWGVFIDWISNGFSYNKMDLVICLSEPAGISNKSKYIINREKLKYIRKYNKKFLLLFYLAKFRDTMYDIKKYYIKPFFKKIMFLF